MEAFDALSSESLHNATVNPLKARNFWNNRGSALGFGFRVWGLAGSAFEV